MKERDHYYKLAKEEGYASRASYKLMQMQKQLKMIAKGDFIVELGAAPGGGSEVLLPLIGHQGRLIAIDLQPLTLPQHPQLEFIQGDFTEAETLQLIMKHAGQKVDLVLSDAAPSTSGVHFRDVARSLALAEAALHVACLLLKPKGKLLVKIFAGDEEDFIRTCKTCFLQVKRLKPDASKKKSREFYLYCSDFTGVR